MRRVGTRRLSACNRSSPDQELHYKDEQKRVCCPLQQQENEREYPSPDITETSVGLFSPTSIPAMIIAAWDHPWENTSVLAVLMVCFLGFYFSTKSTSQESVVVEQLQQSMLSLLVSEIQSLRAEVAELRGFVINACVDVKTVN
ncbi:hypothetical protein THRCLA_20638 [Thraustotheca clavata]|uniref:Uncharacterized protein n=1 Tax=Thraustotheca clavata TaxID=74557 RepID=A0A1W0A575_9STRA|nr:hypothetical protein THRCLA_20638 [Thraustotheca clavata]